MNEVYALENQLEQAKLLSERRAMALRLSENKDFKELILKQFSTEECARYAQASADPALTAEQRADSLAMAQAPGHLRRFLHVVCQMGATAEDSMVELEEAIVDARVAAGDE